VRKYDWHVVSISTGRWSELCAEHAARSTGKFRSLVITMSRICGVAKELYGRVVGECGP
jgi:hypothetical protein